MFYALIGEDAPDSLARRMAVREEHLARLQMLKDEGRLLIAVLVGFSVLIPYIGAFVVTIPVVGVALFQFGAGTEFWSLFAVYLIIQALDGNLLVPVLFSEAVNLHPLVIILSVVIFGGLWGFWGVFFAIPLATLIKAVVHAWPDGLIVEDEH